MRSSIGGRGSIRWLRSQRCGNPATGFSRVATTEWALSQCIRSKSSGSFAGSMEPNIRVRESGWPCASGWWSAEAAGFGWTRSPEADRRFLLHYQRGCEMTATTRKLKIFLAEDNPGDVFLVRRALDFHRIDYELSLAKDGEEALAVVRRVEDGEIVVDLLLVDLNLPRYDGGQIV